MEDPPIPFLSLIHIYWVLGGGLLQPQVLAERGLALGVDITVPRRVMVVSVRDLARYTDTAAGQKRIDQLETAVSGLVELSLIHILLQYTAVSIAQSCIKTQPFRAGARGGTGKKLPPRRPRRIL